MPSILDRRAAVDQRDDGSVPGKISTHWMTFLLGILVAGIVGYFSTVNAFNARISVVESQQQSQKERLERMETKIDVLVARTPR